MSVNQADQPQREEDVARGGTRRQGEDVAALRPIFLVAPSPRRLVALSSASLPLLLRIEQFTQAVSDEVERHDREHHRQSGKDEQVWRDAEETARVI
jgi:hypothetical protein